MKIAKISFLLTITMLALTVLTGCRCVPSSEEWHFFSYKDKMTFIGGVELELGFSDASQAYPFSGISNQSIGVSFSKDGSVIFTDREGITHYGTFTYEHQGLNYTSFTITLENGEVIKGDSIKNGGTKKLALTYKDIIYNFTDENKRNGTTIDDVVKMILSGDFGALNEATVIKKENTYSVVFSEMISYPITKETAVFAMRIHKDGTYEILNEIVEGEVLSTYNDKANYIVIYYVD